MYVSVDFCAVVAFSSFKASDLAVYDLAYTVNCAVSGRYDILFCCIWLPSPLVCAARPLFS